MPSEKIPVCPCLLLKKTDSKVSENQQSLSDCLPFGLLEVENQSGHLSKQTVLSSPNSQSILHRDAG